jgi:hypothetical protein
MIDQVRVRVCDPRHPDARHCLRGYLGELSHRFDGGFDPALSISAEDRELTPPAGLFLVATLRAEPVGCGALKFHHEARPRSSGCGSPPQRAAWAWAVAS